MPVSQIRWRDETWFIAYLSYRLYGVATVGNCPPPPSPFFWTLAAAAAAAAAPSAGGEGALPSDGDPAVFPLWVSAGALNCASIAKLSNPAVGRAGREKEGGLHVLFDVEYIGRRDPSLFFFLSLLILQQQQQQQDSTHWLQGLSPHIIKQIASGHHYTHTQDQNRKRKTHQKVPSSGIRHFSASRN